MAQDSVLNPLGSSIETAEIGDDQVTLAKLAHGTAGKAIGFNSSGVPAEIAAGETRIFISAAGGYSSIALSADANSPYKLAVREFPDAATSEWVSQVSLPSTFDGKDLKIQVVWRQYDINGNNVYWKVFYEAVTDLEQMESEGTIGDTGTDLIDAETAGSGFDIHISPIHTTSAKTFTAGDILQLCVQRLGADANDTSTQRAYLVGVIISY